MHFNVYSREILSLGSCARTKCKGLSLNTAPKPMGKDKCMAQAPVMLLAVFLSQHCQFCSNQTQSCAALLHLSQSWAWEGCRLQNLSVHSALAKCYQDGPVCSCSFCVIPQELVQVSVSPAVLKLCRGCLAVCALLESSCGLWNHRTKWQISPALGMPK